jgi:hypothetical protein
MQATYKFLLSEQGQRAQMAATGQPVAREQKRIEDFDSAWLTSPFVHIDPAGLITVDLGTCLRVGSD